MINFHLSVFLSILSCLTCASHAFYWGYYPDCAQPQLEANGPAQCDTGNPQGVRCLCENATFLSGSAKDIWQHCGCDILQLSASVAGSICQEYGFPIALSKAEMIAAGDGGTNPCVDPSNVSPSSTSSTQVSSTASGGTSPTATRTPDKPTPHHLSTGAIVGIVVATIVLLVAVVLLGVYFWMRRAGRMSGGGPSTVTRIPLGSTFRDWHGR